MNSSPASLATPPTAEREDAQPAVRYLVLIDDVAGRRIARVLLPSLEQVAEFDAAAPEVAAMTDGLLPARNGSQPRWDRVLSGHDAAQRAGALIYTFDV